MRTFRQELREGGDMQNGSGLSVDRMIAFIEHAPANIFFKDTSCRYRAVSKVCALINGKDDCYIIGKTDVEVWADKEVARRYYEDDLRIIATGESSEWIDEFPGQDGPLYLQVSKNPAYLDGELIGVVGIVTDVTEQMRLQAELKRLTETDQLTGLFNRNFLEMRAKDADLDELFPISMVVMDCNHLKETNDRYGHRAGDELIVRTAQVIKDALPSEAVAARLGGDEFIIVCRHMDEQGARELVHALKEGFEKASDGTINVEVAIGCATAEGGADSLLPTFRSADARMYEDKRASRS